MGWISIRRRRWVHEDRGRKRSVDEYEGRNYGTTCMNHGGATLAVLRKHELDLCLLLQRQRTDLDLWDMLEQELRYQQRA